MRFEKHIFYDLIFSGIDSLYITDAAETPLVDSKTTELRGRFKRLSSEVPWHNGETCECF